MYLDRVSRAAVACKRSVSRLEAPYARCAGRRVVVGVASISGEGAALGRGFFLSEDVGLVGSADIPLRAMRVRVWVFGMAFNDDGRDVGGSRAGSVGTWGVGVG